jgi:hypothetical protein
LTESDVNFLRILNWGLRPVFQHGCVSSLYGSTSNLFISCILYTCDIYRQFARPLYAIFSQNDRGLPIPTGDTEDIIAVILSQNGRHHGYLRDRLHSAQGIDTVSMNKREAGMSLVILNSEGFLVNGCQMEVFQNLWHPRKLWRSLSIHCSALKVTDSFLGVPDPISAAILFGLVRSMMLIIVDEVSMLIPEVANRGAVTLQLICVYD